MKTNYLKTIRSIGVIIIATLVISMSGCATKKAAWGSLEKGMNMKYSPNLEKQLSYESKSLFKQTMTVMNQEILVSADMMQVFSMKPVETENADLKFQVTLEDISFDLETPRGNMESDVSGVIGKSFDLTLSMYGEELDYAGAEDIGFELGTGETKRISSDIQAFFPNLPNYPIKTGDSWNSTDKVVDQTDNRKMTLEFNNINTFEQLETIHGYECMKINIIFTGTIEGKGSQEGMELNTTGKIKGSGTWYYAYKEGIFVSNAIDGTGTTETLVIGGPEEMTIPANRTFTMTTQLIPE